MNDPNQAPARPSEGLQTCPQCRVAPIEVTPGGIVFCDTCKLSVANRAAWIEMHRRAADPRAAADVEALREKLSEMIVVRGQALACSPAVKEAFEQAEARVVGMAVALREALTMAAGWRVTDCRGDKCREPHCEACNSEEDAMRASAERKAKFDRLHSIAAGAEQPAPRRECEAHWWCGACMAKVEPRHVTNAEHHDACGTRVAWVEAKDGGGGVGSKP